MIYCAWFDVHPPSHVIGTEYISFGSWQKTSYCIDINRQSVGKSIRKWYNKLQLTSCRRMFQLQPQTQVWHFIQKCKCEHPCSSYATQSGPESPQLFTCSEDFHTFTLRRKHHMEPPAGGLLSKCHKRRAVALIQHYIKFQAMQLIDLLIARVMRVELPCA